MQRQTWENACRENIKAAKGGFRMLHNFFQGVYSWSSCVMLIESVLGGRNAGLIPYTEGLKAWLIFWILSVKKKKNIFLPVAFQHHLL